MQLFYDIQSLDGLDKNGEPADSEGSIEDFDEEGEEELNEEQLAALKESGYGLIGDDDEEGEFDIDDDEEAEYDDEDVEDEDDHDDEDDEPAPKRPKK